MKKLLLALCTILSVSPAYALPTTLFSNSSTGSVGIGTSSPLNSLDVNTGGGIHITTGVPAATSMALYNNAGALTWNGAILGTGSSVSGTTNYIPVFTSSNALGNSVIYQSGSNIGIGTTTPTAPLHVNHVLPTGTISSSGTTVTGSGTNFTSAFSVGDMITSGTQTQAISAITSNTSLTTSSAFSPAFSSGSPYQRLGALLNAGAVGIGTTTPLLPLDVWGIPVVNGSDRAIVNFGDSTPMAADVGGGIEFSGFSTSTVGSEWAGIKSGKANGTSGDVGAYLAFLTRTNGSLTAERMRIDNLGNVGIGTSNPANPLDVVGGIILRSANPNIPASGVGDYLHIGYDSGNNWGYIAARDNALVSQILRIDGAPLILNMNGGAGNVGIKTTSPSYTLQVNGSVAGTSNYVNTSDARLKTDVEPISYGLDTVMKLNPISFNWKNQDQDWKKQHQIGLVAQEVEPVVPEAVSTAGDEMQTKGIAYGALVPVLIKAIQDLKTENDGLRKDFEEYKKEHP